MSDRINKILDFLKANPNDLFLNHALALEYVKIGNEENAKKFFEANLACDPNYIATYYHLGKLLERTKHNEDALDCYQKGMNIAKMANDNHSYNELQAAYEDLAEW
jgi:tetratricopeptide (TPR) repeat protein